MYVWWFSPLMFIGSNFVFFPFQHVGEITQERSFNLDSRSPLSEPELFLFEVVGFITCRGDSQGRWSISTLILPSLNRSFLCCARIFISCRGDYTGEEELFNSRSPLCFLPILHPPDFRHFLWAQILDAFPRRVRYIVGRAGMTTLLYVYI